MKKIIFLTLIINSLCFIGFSQDIIVKTNKDTVKCQVKEIGDTEIKYTQKDFRGDVVFGIDKNAVKQVIFSDQKELSFKDPMTDPASYSSQHKNAIKAGFLSPLFGATSFSFEHSLKPGSSVEATIGIIGLGTDIANNKSSGVYLKFGYKFIKSPDFYLKGMQYAHILKGAYIRPEFSFSTYKSETGQEFLSGGTPVPGTNKTGNTTMFSFMINFGKQWVFQDKFLFDWFVGLGYGVGTSFNDISFHYAFMGGSSGPAFALTSGLRVGMLF